jgi:hypothetical protein
MFYASKRRREEGGDTRWLEPRAPKSAPHPTPDEIRAKRSERADYHTFPPGF